MLNQWLQVLEKPIKYLKFCGVWVDNDSSRVRQIFHLIVHFTLIDIYFVFSAMYLFTNNNLQDFSEAIGISTTLFGVCYKIKYFYFKKDQFVDLLTSLEELIEFESWIDKGKGERLRERLKKVDRIFKIFMTMTMVGLVSGAVVPFTSHIMPYKMWFPYDYNSSEIVFWTSVAYQLIPGFIYGPVIIIIDTLPAFMMSYVTGMLEELSERLESPGEERRNELSSKKLIKSIKIQLKIKALTAEIGEIFGKVIWVQGFLSTLILCTTSYALTIVSLLVFAFNSNSSHLRISSTG